MQIADNIVCRLRNCYFIRGECHMELWDAYTRDEVRIGKTLVRDEPIPDRLYHLVSEILVQHTDGDYLLMQRDPAKKAYPGWWEATAGGSALVGEDALACAKRELSEETGIASGTFTEIAHEIAEPIHTIYHTFLCVTDAPKDSVRLQEGETVAYRWLKPTEFRAFAVSVEMIDHQKARLAPYLRELFPDAGL